MAASPSSRRAMNLRRHRVTVPGVIRRSAATCFFGTLCAQASTIFDRNARACAVFARCDQRVSWSRSPALSTSPAFRPPRPRTVGQPVQPRRDEALAAPAGIVACRSGAGGRWADHRTVINGILFRAAGRWTGRGRRSWMGCGSAATRPTARTGWSAPTPRSPAPTSTPPGLAASRPPTTPQGHGRMTSIRPRAGPAGRRSAVPAVGRPPRFTLPWTCAAAPSPGSPAPASMAIRRTFPR